MNAFFRVVSAVIIGALSLLAIISPTAGQGATGTVNIQVVYCPQLEMAAELPGVPAEFCSPGPGQFSFYLVGDGTADFELLDVPLTGTASIDLPVGEYEVYEENTFVKMSVFVEADETTSIVFGIPSESGPETPSGEFYISAWECPGVTDVAFTDVVGADCVRIATDLSYYLIGDGTSTYYHVPTLATEAMLVGLPLGDYEVVHEASQTHLFMTVSEETGDVHLVVPGESEPVTPVPGGDVYVSTWACPGVSVVSFAEVVPADCVRIATNLTFYLMGDGTDAHHSVTTLTTGAVHESLPLGMYKVIDEPTQAHVYVTVSEEPSDAHIVYPKAADPVTPTPVPTKVPAAPVATKVPTTTVTKLPSTGSGPDANVVALGAIVVGAMLTVGAVGLQLRKA